MNETKTSEELKAEFLRWRQLEAEERMQSVRLGESGALSWSASRETSDFDRSSLLYEIELEAERLGKGSASIPMT